ncbi:hypothetical protein MMC25_000994 [Agyrium rufum]|nr:hypothetical protein [Agyrium rufum]
MPSSAKRYSLVFFVAAGLLYILYSVQQQPFQTASQSITSKTKPAGAGSPPSAEDEWIDWSQVPQHYPVSQESMKTLPAGRPANIPKIQHTFGYEDAEAKKVRLQRQAAVKESFQHTWQGYKKHAWMKDEVSPLTGGSQASFGGWAATLVDSLDTLWIMGFKEEFKEAVKAAAKINFSRSSGDAINVFETTIRYLGGFLAAYDLSGEKVLLQKAEELGEMLYFSFDTPNRMPMTPWHWKPAVKGALQEAGVSTLIAEIGSLSLEFTRLSQLTGNPKFFDAIQRISDLLDAQQNQTSLPGMWPFVINAAEGDFTQGSSFTLGAMSDSLYEYFPKQYVLLGGLSDQYRKLYEGAINTVRKYNLFRPMNKDNLDILVSTAVDIRKGAVERDSQGQHLVCFVGGMMGIASKIFGLDDDLKTARKLTDGCIWAYEASPNGIMPETFNAVACNDECMWDEKRWHQAILDRNPACGEDAEECVNLRRLPPGMIEVSDRRYILRPEAIESVYIMYRITGDKVLQDKAWKMFSAIEKHTRTEIAHAALDDVMVPEPPKADKMESFWPAETLKYFYLIFSDPELISLDDYVFNTEAHPLRRPKSPGMMNWWG